MKRISFPDELTLDIEKANPEKIVCLLGDMAGVLINDPSGGYYIAWSNGVKTESVDNLKRRLYGALWVRIFSTLKLK